MRRAIELALSAKGRTNPNPMVGAVIVKDGRVIGEGYHHRYGDLHAERDAIKNLKNSAQGATIYVTLEPCCHYGKQPPCTLAIVEAGISRVVIGSRDPNPLVSGQGAAFLSYVLPEAQTDRFMFKLLMTFPEEAELCRIVRLTQDTQEERAARVMNGEELLAMRETAKQIPVIDEVVEYAARLVAATHPELDGAPETTKKELRFGASPRAVQALISGGRILALTDGRYNVSRDDVDALACPVLRHRVKLTYDSIMRGRTPDEVIRALIDELRGRRPKTGKTEDAEKQNRRIFTRA